CPDLAATARPGPNAGALPVVLGAAAAALAVAAAGQAPSLPAARPGSVGHPGRPRCDAPVAVAARPVLAAHFRRGVAGRCPARRRRPRFPGAARRSTGLVRAGGVAGLARPGPGAVV